MIYGISGCSGSGKTTLAKKVAEELGFEFVPASVTEMGKQVGRDPVSVISLMDRITFQAKLLQVFLEKIRALGTKRRIIMDRTPLDTIGYLMAEIHMHSHQDADDDLLRLAHKLTRGAQGATAMYFKHVFLTTPLPTYEEAPTRPVSNPAYQSHVHLLITGAAYASHTPIDFTLLSLPELDARVHWMKSSILEQEERTEALRSRSRYAH